MSQNQNFKKIAEILSKNQQKVYENKLREQMLKIHHPRRCTEMEILAGPITVRCFVSNQLSTRNRRQLLLTLFRAVKPHLQFIKRSTIHHRHHMLPDIFNKDEFLQLSVRQGIHVTNNDKKIGYFIRGIRTKLGKTQKVFAKELAIDANYLSSIERGIRSPSRKIVQKIFELKMKRKILMVCLGNICRSPLAEGVMLQVLKEKGWSDRYEVDSAGTIAAHLGELPDHRARKVAENNGFKLTHTARQFTKKDFEFFDDILVMDDSNYDDVVSLTKDPAHVSKVKRIVDFDQRSDAPQEVADPYLGSLKHFEAVYEQLRHCVYGFFLQNHS